MQKNLNELNIKGDNGRLEEDGVFGKETLSAWMRFLNTLEHGTLPTLTWVDPLKGHDRDFIITSSRHGYNNVIAGADNSFQYYRIDSAHGGRAKFRGQVIENVDFNHLNVNFPIPMTPKQIDKKFKYDHMKIPDKLYKHINNLDKAGKKVRVAGRWLCVAGAALDALELGLSVADDLKDEDRKLGKKAATTAVSIGGRWGGAALGAKIGAVAGGFTGLAAPFAIPVLSLIGGVAGSFSGDTLAKWVIDITNIGA